MPEIAGQPPPYTGDVTPGGAPAVRDAGGLRITKVAVGPMNNNAYLLRCTATGEQVLIDAAASAAVLLELAGGRLDGVITTHCHPDHWGALAEVAARTGARTYAGELDAPQIPVATTAALADGDAVIVGAVRLTAWQVPGHTPGSIVLAYQEPDGRAHLFTGDCLFPGGVGRTTSPENFRTLYGAVTTKLFDRHPDSTWVYPGHGRDTTLGAERPHLAHWRARGW